MYELIRKRGRVKGKLTRINTFLTQLSLSTVVRADIDVRLHTLVDIWTEFDDIQSTIEETCNDVELSGHKKEQCEFEQQYYTTKSGLLTIQVQLAQPATSDVQEPDDGSANKAKDTTHDHANSVKLPRIDLPTFSGNYKDWVSFSDLFKAVVHNNESISQVQKLHYLKSALKDDAARILHSLAITEANYVEAWNILNNRYANKRQIIQAHVAALHAQPRVQHESAKELRKLIDNTTENLRALSALGVPTEYWDCMMVFVVTDRVDTTTRRQWEITSADSDNPTFLELKKFIEKRCRALEASQPINKESTLPAKTNRQQQRRVHDAAAYQSLIAKCTLCKDSHSLFKCNKFMHMSVTERFAFVRQSGLCINCLKHGHLSRLCPSSHCRKCNQKHNTLLHRDNEPLQGQGTSSETSGVTAHYTARPLNQTYVLLATAQVGVQDSRGQIESVRVLLDSASQSSFVSERCMRRLGLRRNDTTTFISGIGGNSSGSSCGRVQMTLRSLCQAHKFVITALILRQVTAELPQQQISQNMVTATVTKYGLQLADPEYYKPGNIDILIGADVYYNLLLPGQIRPFDTGLTLQNSILGWIVGGPVPGIHLQQGIASYHAHESLNYQLKRFWELEDVPHVHTLTAEEEQCEDHFLATHGRTTSGRFMVKLPFGRLPIKLANTKSIAMSRLQQMERRLQTNLQTKKGYVDFMEEYSTLGHMEVASVAKSTVQPYYLSHHCVIKNEATTTELRVVFDGSACSPSELSLNEALLVGPRLQKELPDIITNFRRHNIVYTADISKMYRQVLVHPDHRDYQRILWRVNSIDPIMEYNLCTLTYGTSSAPYLAVRCLVELAKLGKSEYPLASHIIQNDFYVDDVLTGHNTVNEAIASKSQLVALLEEGGFRLHKWASNSQQLINTIPAVDRYAGDSVDFAPDVRTLGIVWDSFDDQFKFNVKIAKLDKLSKRTILAQIARLFDPLGWVAPVVVWAKILMQSLWLQPVGWDDKLPDDIIKQWEVYKENLPALEKIRIPRRLTIDSSNPMYQVHGFCDASEMAYGAVIYIRSCDKLSICTRLLQAKSKVAPLKRVSLPRLELCGAALLVRLLTHIRDSLCINDDQIHLWTDSTIVLAWLSKPSHHWKSFVANRVSEIQQKFNIDHWRHIKSQDNPADCLSRGIMPHQLQHHPLWWTGPPWLSKNPEAWPLHCQSDVHSGQYPLQESRVIRSHVSGISELPHFKVRFSTWSSMVRVTAYCFRFINNCRVSNKVKTSLNWLELMRSKTYWYHLAQQEAFPLELQCCSKNQPIKNNSTLCALNPFVDEQGILRVGGRLESSSVSYHRKHPIILPKGHQVTILIINDFHQKYLHAGPQLLLAILRQQFWIIHARSIIRQVVHRCVKCFRCKVSTAEQMMGGLPDHRVNPVRPFFRAGVDYAGPISTRASRGRGRIKTFKSYICLFVCFVTKAIHLELVSDLTSETFLAALRRFISRRGKPADIYSDRGTNFVGANRELTELTNFLKSSHHKNQLVRFAETESITWHFNPPMAPHFGGLWEAGVKSVKYHLRRTMGPNILTYEELYTLLVQIESCLNSRPLCQISDDPESLDFLTPGHFLIGEALTAIPDRRQTDGPSNLLTRWGLVQRSYQQFWHRWSAEYMSGLQQRPKWVTPKLNFKIGDLVILKEKDLMPLKWPMARITDVHPGPDGLVRVVTVKTSTNTLKRPISSCCLLPLDKA